MGKMLLVFVPMGLVAVASVDVVVAIAGGAGGGGFAGVVVLVAVVVFVVGFQRMSFQILSFHKMRLECCVSWQFWWDVSGFPWYCWDGKTGRMQG